MLKEQKLRKLKAKINEAEERAFDCEIEFESLLAADKIEEADTAKERMLEWYSVHKRLKVVYEEIKNAKNPTKTS